MSISFAGKRVLVNGAAGAIGARCAALLEELGAAVVRTDARLEPACDVRRSADVERLRARVLEGGARLDAVVLCAGIYRPAMLAGMTDEEWRETLEVNLTGAFNFIRAFGGHVAPGGAIVALASVAQRGSASFGHYAASKAGLVGLVRSAALELSPHVRVNAVSPGPIETPMVAPLMERRGPEVLAQIPSKRLGSVDEVAKAVAFLASDWASYVNGENLQLNGGLYMA
jgi:3-oxoacyl-[acyl-carrier protein] reductase